MFLKKIHLNLGFQINLTLRNNKIIILNSLGLYKRKIKMILFWSKHFKIILNLCNNFNSQSNHLLKQNQEWECQLMVGRKGERKMIDKQQLLFFLVLNLVCLIKLKILILKIQIENKRYRVNKMIIILFWNHL